MRDFPSEIPASQAQWATMVPGRAPEFKVHSKRGLANSAVANKKPYQECAIYELQGDKWVKTWEYVYPEVCSCGNTFTNNRRRGRYLIPYGYDGRVMDAPVVCEECYYRDYTRLVQARQEDREREQLAALQAKYNK